MIALNGKIFRSAREMEGHLHITRAQISELSIIFAPKSVKENNSEILTVQQLIGAGILGT